MKKIFQLTTVLLLISACPVITHAVVDSGRQYSSTREKCKAGDLELQLNRVYKLYRESQQSLDKTEKKQLRTSLRSIYLQLKKDPALLASPGSLMNKLTRNMPPAKATHEKEKQITKNKHLSFSKLRTFSILKRFEADLEAPEEANPKRREFKLFKGLNFK